MKIFSWMQNKLNGKQVTKKINTVAPNNQQGISKEEFSDWPQSLLAIGTFGNTTSKHTPTTEQVNSCLDTRTKDEEKKSDTVCDQELVLNKDHYRLQRSISSRGKVDNHKNNLIRKKSLTFLLKKLFKSRNNNLNHSLPDPSTFEKSRLDKILRAILNKKIHPQTSNTKPMAKKYLVRKEDICMAIAMEAENDYDYDNDDDDDQTLEDDNEGSMWVKTDSEYIVLEI